MSTAPQVASRAPGTEAGADRHRPAEGAPRPNTAEPEQAVTEMPTREGGGLIPAFPAAERAVRALSEAVKYAQWRREAVDPGRVPEFEDIDEKGAAALIGRLLARGAGPHPRRRRHLRPARQVRPRRPPRAPRTHPGCRRRSRPHPRLPGRPQGHRPAPAPPRRPGRRPPRSRGRGPTAAGVRRVGGAVRAPGGAAAGGAADGSARGRHRRTGRHRPGGRGRAVVRAGRGRLAAARGHRAPADSGHGPGGRLAGPVDPDGAAPVRLARLHTRSTRLPWRS